MIQGLSKSNRSLVFQIRPGQARRENRGHLQVYQPSYGDVLHESKLRVLETRHQQSNHRKRLGFTRQLYLTAMATGDSSHFIPSVLH
jgi:hypothetical protein